MCLLPTRQELLLRLRSYYLLPKIRQEIFLQSLLPTFRTRDTLEAAVVFFPKLYPSLINNGLHLSREWQCICHCHPFQTRPIRLFFGTLSERLEKSQIRTFCRHPRSTSLALHTRKRH